MATIYTNRKDGKIVSFKFKVFLGKEASGKHIVKCKTWFPDREMTEKKLRALAEKEAILFEHEAAAQYEEEQKRFNPSEITFADFVEQVWLPSKINMDEVRTTTIVFHKSMLKIILPYFQGKQLKNITDKDITKYLDYLRKDYCSAKKKPLAPKSVRHHYCTLNLIFSYAVKLDYIEKNPLAKVDTPKLVKHKVNALSKAETQIFIQEIQKLPLWLKTMYNLLLTTGIRRGECFGLQWQDVDFINRLIRIKRSVTYTSMSGIIVGLPKTQAGLREIPLTDGMINLLQEYKSKENAAATAFVFHSETSPFDPHHPDFATDHLKKFMKKIGLPDMSPHDLRHTCASLLLQSGADIKSVQDILGHADASTTLNFYVKSDMANMRTATANAFNW
ncbi:MAG: site-specific integrase [Clostridia bacterium]|nr:site-specific integrase [Clostridia bacterium]